MSRDAAEAEEWEGFVHVIRLNNLANVPDGRFILIVLTEIVQRGRRRWVTVRSRVVYGTDNRDAPACPQVVDEGWLLEELPVLEDELCACFSVELFGPRLQLINSELHLINHLIQLGPHRKPDLRVFVVVT